MLPQVSGLLRDAWWFLPMIVVGALVLGVVVKPFIGVVTIFVSLGILVYFALMRYDEHGQERSQDV